MSYRPGEVVLIDRIGGKQTVRGRIREVMWKVDLEDGSTICVDERRLRILNESNVIALPLRLPTPCTIADMDDGAA
jgi:hypothetical protein